MNPTLGAGLKWFLWFMGTAIIGILVYGNNDVKIVRLIFSVITLVLMFDVEELKKKLK